MKEPYRVKRPNKVKSNIFTAKLYIEETGDTFALRAQLCSVRTKTSNGELLVKIIMYTILSKTIQPLSICY